MYAIHVGKMGLRICWESSRAAPPECKETAHHNVRDIVIIKEDKKPRNMRKLAMVKRLIMGREGVVQVVKLKTGNGYFEKAVQHLFPLELSCDIQIREQWTVCIIDQILIQAR